MGSKNNNVYDSGNHCQTVKTLKVEADTEVEKKVSSSFDGQRVIDNHTAATTHHYLSTCSALDTPVSSDNGRKYDSGNPCVCSSSTFLANGNALQICARCLSPILGHRRKSKMCELCMAKMTYGITNEFSERKLNQRRATLLRNNPACNQSNQWPSLGMTSGLQEPACQNASSLEDRCAVYHHHHHHSHYPIPLLSSPVRFDVACAGLCPPPNVFPFGDGIAGVKTSEDDDEVNAPSVLPTLPVHGNPIWRPFD